MIKSIEEANIEKGTRVLIRTDWNVPIDKEGKVLDNSRIKATIKTIDFVLGRGAKAIILSHMGDGSDSLEPVFEEAKKLFPNTKVKFVRDPWNFSSEDGRSVLDNLSNGEIAVMQNLRFWREKENDINFAKRLSQFGDIYINEAFPVSHRVHTSIVFLPSLLPHFAGYRFLEEYNRLSEAFNPEHPFLFILGGVKFETKLPLIEKFLDSADSIFIGGAIAKHASAQPIGAHPKIIMPSGDLEALDVNEETLEVLKLKIENSKFILWNGPLGNYENGYKDGTLRLAKMLSESDSKVIVGGGDTLAAIKELGIINKFYFASMAGGAMLDFLANETLPGIEALI